MTWVKLDDQFFAHPKVIDLSKDAKLLYLAGLTHCAAQLTDGALSSGAIRAITALVDVDRSCVNELVHAGLWEVTETGYAVHDYLKYNRTGEQIKAEREASAERQARFKQRFYKEGNGVTHAVSNGVSNANPTPLLTQSRTHPVPTPVPRPTPEEKEPLPRARAREDATAVAVVVVDTPHAVVAGFLEELGTAEDEVSPAWKSKQRGIAKRLIEQGFGVDKVRRCTRFMLSETWRESPFDLLGVEKTIGSWEARGSPETAGTLKAQRQVEVTDLSPAMQAIVQFRRDHEGAELHDVHGKNGHAGSLPARTDGNRPRVVDTVGGVLPGAATGET